MAITCTIFTLILASTNPARDIPLHENFDAIADGSLPTGWTTDGGKWSVVEGRLRGAALDGEATVWFGPSDARDMSLSADVRFIEAREETRWVALTLRDAGHDSPGIQFTVRHDPARRNGLELAARRPASAGGDWRVFQTATGPQQCTPGECHRLRIEERGDWIRACLDAHTIFECPRGADISKTGRTGLRINGAIVEFDNVVIESTTPMSVNELRRLRSRPLVVAHRGFLSRAPENTLAAYRLAIQAGADMAECDVHLTADRVPVLLHDDNLKRTTGCDAPVASLPLSEVQTLDAGSWKSPEFAAERVPTLTETLQLIHRQLRLVIEIKSTGMESEVLAAVRQAGVQPQDVMIFSFNRGVVDEIAKAEPRLPTTWLIGDLPYEEDARRAMIADALSARCSAIGLPRTSADPAILRLAHESGLSVFVWTVNDPADMRYLLRIGVDAIITDCPDVLLGILAE